MLSGNLFICFKFIHSCIGRCITDGSMAALVISDFKLSYKNIDLLVLHNILTHLLYPFSFMTSSAHIEVCHDNNFLHLIYSEEY